MNTELLEAIQLIEKEKNISRESLITGIEDALMTACKGHFDTVDNVKLEMDHDTCEYSIYAEKTVVDGEPQDKDLEISKEDAALVAPEAKVGDVIRVPIESKEFGRIATQKAKSLILQKIREEERQVVYDEFKAKEHTVVTGRVQRFIGRNINVNLGHADAVLTEKEQARGEHYRQGDRIKLYIVEVKDSPRAPRILVSRTHPDLVRLLFTEEVAEIRDGTVQIMGIAREAGSRTKMAVYSSNPDVDPVGACVGMNGMRVNAVVDQLGGEKIDIINWDENPAYFIENALSPAKIISVAVDPDEKIAEVIVPDYVLSLAIGKSGQNARLAARLTGYKIDIMSETQAIEEGALPADYMEALGNYPMQPVYEDEAYEDDEYDEEAVEEPELTDEPEEAAEEVIDEAEEAAEEVEEAVEEAEEAAEETEEAAEETAEEE